MKLKDELLKITDCFEQNQIDHVGTSQETHLFRVSRADGAERVTLDLLLVTPILEEVWSDREVIDLEGQSLRLVSRAGLIKMKQLAGRPQNLADIEALNRLENP